MTVLRLPPCFAVRLETHGRPWRLSRESELDVELANLPLARRLGEPGVPFSFVALAGRYVYELLASAASRCAKKRAVLALNPVWDSPPLVLKALLAYLNDALQGDKHVDARIFVDYEERILGYWFRTAGMVPGLKREVLIDLSCVDAALDAQLLEALGLSVDVCRVRLASDLYLPPAIPNFQGVQIVAKHTALARLRSLRANSKSCWAVVTHHAGDVFLALKAIQASQAPIDGIVTHAAYADIVKDVLPDASCIALEAPLPWRGALASPAHQLNDDVLYFEDYVLPAFPKDAALQYLRPVRGYLDADYTMGAQLAFALGRQEDVSLFPNAIVPPRTDCLNEISRESIEVPGPRVLLHFDGGWPIKIYPRAAQLELIADLQAFGFEVTVLAASGQEYSAVQQAKFTTLADLKALIQAHDLVIGMDSFPCHYASLQLNKPTICLFGSTSSTNLAHDTDNYIAMERGFPCSPCGSRVECPQFGGRECKNFVSPEMIIDRLVPVWVTS